MKWASGAFVGLLLLAITQSASAQIVTPQITPPAETAKTAPRPEVQPTVHPINAPSSPSEMTLPVTEQPTAGIPIGQFGKPATNVSQHAASTPVSPEVQSAFDQYQVQFYNFLGQQTEIAIENFKWQRHASEILMWTVLLVVFCGLAFSGYQLYQATRAGDSVPTSEVEISADKVRITSSIVGLVVLFISVAFLYLFLVEVYRVKTVDLVQQPTAVVQPGSNVDPAQRQRQP